MDMSIKSTIKEIEKTIEKAMDKITPIASKEIKKEVSTIANQAKNNWPVRQKKYGESKGSKDKIKPSMQTSGLVTTGSISNSAQYAWAIKSGKESDTTVSPGKRIVDELIYKPAKKASDKIGKSIASELLNNIRRD